MTDSAAALVLVCVFAAATLAITWWASRRSTGRAADFYSADRNFFPLENGLALTGGYLSAASFLGICGLISLVGYDGLLYSVGFLVAWLLVLMVVAELVRNTGRYTLADVLGTRMRDPAVRRASGIASVVIELMYLVAQMVGAGSLLSLLLGGDGEAVKAWAVVGVGVLMSAYIAFGGMRAAQWIQIVKAVLLSVGTLVLAGLVLARYGGDFGELLRSAAARSGHGDAFLSPGLKYGKSWATKLDFVSLGMALVLGTAGLPHVVSHFYTVPTARMARRSVVWAIGFIGVFYLLTVVLGFGAAAIVGGDRIKASNEAGNTAVTLLARELGGGAGTLGGTLLFAVVCAIAFATILAVVAGLTLAAASAVAHDLYPAVELSLRRRRLRAGRLPAQREPRSAREAREVRVAKIAAVGVGVLAILLSLAASKLNVAFLVGLAFALAASSNLPALLFNLFWPRFTARGTVWAIYGGLLPALVLVVFSPVVSGEPTSLVPGMDFHWFPLENPGVVSIPMGFLAGWYGAVTDPERPDRARHAEVEVRALTGAGSA
ncbi:solute symporter family protein [Phaeacidiphilus oryzae]|uniref:solute symporter family protein n=1 Tax=Phaeacidiphilus oryzae TaxID=348818 RepID=UPI000561EE57|nr:cation acetate symporter [Phaeacidiphilus oryzae]